MKGWLKIAAPVAGAIALDLVAVAGGVAVMHGLGMIWAPLPWLFGGLALVAISAKLKGKAGE